MQKYLKPEQYKKMGHRFTYPSDKIDPVLKKEKQYFLHMNNAFYCDYINNNCYVPFEFGSKRTFEELRAYARGQQPSSKVKQNLLGAKRKNDQGKYVTKMNVSFDTYYKLPQMFDVMREKNMRHEYGVSVHCIDYDSVAAKEVEREALKYLLDYRTKEFVERMQMKPNFEITPEAIGLMNEEDVDMYFETGGYTLQREIACAAACEKTKMESDYKVLQDATFDDLITNTEGLTAWKTYIEESTKIPKIRKCFVDMCLIPYSRKNDFSDITRFGELRVMTIADIRKENPSFSSAELMYLAKSFSWMNPNYAALIGQSGMFARRDSGNYLADYDIDPISRCQVLVLDSQWLSTDIETHIKNVTGKGHVRLKEVDFNYEIDKKARRSGDQKVQKNVIRKYHSQWIVGTDMFLNYGVCKDVVYYGEDGNKTPRLDFFAVKTGNASLVERCIAIVDDIDMAIIKQRNALATIPAAPAMAIQKDLLENVMLNGILQEPDDIVQGLIERGILYYNGLDEDGKPLYFAGGQKPIDFMDLTKIAGMLAVYSAHIFEKVNELREVLGLQNGADAGGTSAYQGLGQTELAFQAANASLYPTFNAYNYLFRAAFTDIIKKWQIVAKDKDIKLSYSLLSNKNLNIFRLGKDFSNSEFNMDIKISPSAQERQNLLSDIAQLKALGVQTDGSQGLTGSEYMFVWKRVMAGMIDEAMFVLAQIERKKRFNKSQQDQQNIQSNADVQQQSLQQKAALERENILAKGETQNTNTLISELLKQNSLLMGKLFETQQVGQVIPNRGEAEAIISANNNTVATILAPPEQPLPQGGQQPMMEQEMMPQGL